MPKYTVNNVIQSGDNEPVDVQWYRGDNLAKALAALVQSATHDVDVDHGDLPESMRFHVNSVSLTILNDK
jgi:hypothetical protein